MKVAPYLIGGVGGRVCGDKPPSPLSGAANERSPAPPRYYSLPREGATAASPRGPSVILPDSPPVSLCQNPSPPPATHVSVLRGLGWVLEECHGLGPIVPQEGGVVQPALARDGLGIAAKLALLKHIV